MERLYQEMRDKDFEIVAVSVDAPIGQTDVVGNPGGDIRAFADSLSLTFPIRFPTPGSVGIEPMILDTFLGRFDRNDNLYGSVQL
jgi:hypothetical protein